MRHKIFLSHNHNDKPLVEAVALKLAMIFGKDQVFYDSWSIKPGDGIIDQMNSGLEAPEFVFFFVSRSSLASGMVKLEWQNALYAASKGKTRIVPVRVDGTDMPALLKQTLFIDMHTVGLEAAIAQIVSVTQGNASFTPQHAGFSNLSYTADLTADGGLDVVVRASHLMEPNPRFVLAVTNDENELGWSIVGESSIIAGFNRDSVNLANGEKVHGVFLHPMGRALTPSLPMRMRLDKRGDTPIGFVGVLHQKSETEWVPVPRAWSGTVTSSKSRVS